MTKPPNTKRRAILRASLASAMAAGSVWPFAALVPPDALAQPASANSGFVPDLIVELRAKRDTLRIWPGPTTRVWRYDGRVVAGDPSALSFVANGYAPILRVRRGQKIRINFINELSEPTIIHWHGLTVPAALDGHPRDAIGTGRRYVYEFEVRNRAGTYWFHAHPDGRTGAQVYYGQAGFLLVSDEEEAFGLPKGEHDMPLMIEDGRVDADNQFVYLAQRAGGMMGRGMMGGGMSGMMERMMGFLGDRILVNGQPDYVLPVATRAYRLRLLNGSNSRIYKFARRDGVPLTVIGTDGGLLGQPLKRPYVTLAPAERVDLWIDFAGQPVGTDIALDSLPFDGDAAMGGMMGGLTLPMGAHFPIMKFRVARREQAHDQLPPKFKPLPPIRAQDAINATQPRTFGITMGMMTWGINGRRFQMDGVTSSETVRAGTTEIWEFRNDESMMLMAHAMHVHNVQFRVLDRSVAADLAAARATLSGGYVDEGWKDTVLVMPGERVRVLMHFGSYTGLFLYHCHMLEHEDTGLMRNYLIRT